jgi:hypothetical protein
MESIRTNLKAHPEMTEQDEVEYAAAWLGQSHKQRWLTYKRTINLDTFSMNDFKNWMEDQIETPAVRSLNATVRLATLQMKDHQTPYDFYPIFTHVYDQSKEERTLTDVDKCNTFISKLPDDIQKDMIQKQKKYINMADCINDAQLTWDLLRRNHRSSHSSKKRKDDDDRDERNQSSKRGRGGRGNPRGRGRGRGGHRGGRSGGDKGNSKDDKDQKSDLTCYRCGRKNHISPDCRATYHVDGRQLDPKPNKPSRLGALKDKDETNDDNTSEEQE